MFTSCEGRNLIVFIVMIFIAILIIVVLFVVLLNSNRKNISKSKTTYERIINIDLTGFTHYEEFEVKGLFDETTKSYIIQFCKEKHPVILKHEKDNLYSKKAIKIIHEGFEIGYVPEEMTEEIFPILNQKHQALISQVFYSGTYINSVKLFR